MKGFNKNSIAAALSAGLTLGLIGPLAAFAASPSTVNLGSAGNFTILAKTGISTTGATSVIGDIGVSPAAATYITGFGLVLPSAGTFSTSALVTGKIYASDYASPTPTNLTSAILDMQNAYTSASGRAPDVTELGAGNIGGLTLVPGVYKWSSGVTVATDVTLSGGANDVWIFQIAQNLFVSSAKKIVLAGGAQASNIFWIVAGQTTLGTTSVFNGNILNQTAIVLNTGATLNGRALAQAAVTLDSNAVTMPASAVSAPAPAVSAAPTTPTPTPVQATVSPSASSGAVATQTQSQLSDDIVSQTVQLDSLLNTLRSLQEQAKQQGHFAAGNSGLGQEVRTIAINLGWGAKDNDVAILQRFLISQNKGQAARALAAVGATSYFGEMTRSALAEFQESAGIRPALGNFGPITRNYISTH